MVLIADSGSTKVHWCLVTASGQCSDVFTDGINPLFQTTDAMRNSICNQLLPKIAPLLWAGTLTHVFFYGAGCTPEKKVFVQKALEAVFKKAEVQVESDMLGAARGLLGRNAGVACILGTGSGSCFYNGETIEWCVPSLGYILGDEGSAAVLGKRLVGDLLKNQLSYSVSGLSDEVDLKNLFFKDIDDPRIRNLVYDHFVQFIRRNLVQYFQNTNANANAAGVGFVGSIAYYYRPILEEAMQTEGLPMGTVLQDPIEGLKEYHKDAIMPTTE